VLGSDYSEALMWRRCRERESTESNIKRERGERGEGEGALLEREWILYKS